MTNNSGSFFPYIPPNLNYIINISINLPSYWIIDSKYLNFATCWMTCSPNLTSTSFSTRLLSSTLSNKISNLVFLLWIMICLSLIGPIRRNKDDYLLDLMKNRYKTPLSPKFGHLLIVFFNPALDTSNWWLQNLQRVSIKALGGLISRITSDLYHLIIIVNGFRILIAISVNSTN